MQRISYAVLAVTAMAVTFVAAAAATMAIPSKKVLDERPVVTTPASVDPTTVAVAPVTAPETLVPMPRVEPITDDEDPAVIESPEIANGVIAHAGADALLAAVPVTPAAASPSAPAEEAVTSRRQRTGLAADTPAITRDTVTRDIRDQMVSLLLCTSGNDNYCLMGNESAFWVGENGMTRMSEGQITNVVRQEGGYVALCVRGTLTSFEATDQDPETGLWKVNIRRIDTSLSTSSTRLAGYDDGRQGWVGAVRDAPSVTRAPKRRTIARGNTEHGLEDYHDGQKIWRGAPTPAE